MKRLLIVVVLVLAACGESPAVQTSVDGTSLHTIHDAKHHVTCWVLSAYSLSCLPDAQVVQP